MILTVCASRFAGKPRAATVVAQSNGILWRLSRGDFRAAVQSGRVDPLLLLVRCLKSCELLEPLTNGQLMVMADMMQPVCGVEGVLGGVGGAFGLG
jgi:CRP-like cAMP-binding protein